MKNAGRKTRFDRLYRFVSKEVERLAKKTVRRADRLGYDMFADETIGIILYALNMGVPVSIEVLKRRCMATEREFGKHAIRRALQGRLKTTKPLWQVCKPRRTRKPLRRSAAVGKTSDAERFPSGENPKQISHAARLSQPSWQHRQRQEHLDCRTPPMPPPWPSAPRRRPACHGG